MIPDEAIGFDQSQQFVLVVDADNKVRRQVVSLGRIQDGFRIIRSGIGKDDLVIISGIQRVRSGTQADPELVDLNQPDETATADAP
jgi:multidrug efflux system membrane fusion protein